MPSAAGADALVEPNPLREILMRLETWRSPANRNVDVELVTQQDARIALPYFEAAVPFLDGLWQALRARAKSPGG
jgi:hypothetical protein